MIYLWSNVVFDVKEVVTNDKTKKGLDFISIGDIEFCPTTLLIKVDDETKSIPPYACSILLELAKAYPSSISRRSLIEKVWKEKSCTKETLQKHIENLRAIINDKRPKNDKAYQYQIIGIPTPNYLILLQRVEFFYLDADNATAKTRLERRIESREIKSRLRSKPWLAAATILIASPLFALLGSSDYRAIDYELVTNIKGEKERATYSKINDILIFMNKSNDSKSWDLVANRQSTDEQSIIFKGTRPNEYNTEPSFSPSGNKIAWVNTDYSNFCDVLVADFDPHELKLDNVNSVVDCLSDNFGRTPQWKNEKTILVSLSLGALQPSGIYQVDLNDNSRHLITAPRNSAVGDYNLAYNEQANMVAYLRQSAKKGIGSELRIYDFDTKEDKLINEFKNPIYATAWLNENSLVVRPDKNFEVVSLSGHREVVEFNSVLSKSFPFSFGENEIGFVAGNLRESDVVLVNLLESTTDYKYSTTKHDYRSVIAKDTNEVAYVSLVSGSHQIYLSNNGVAKPLTKFSGRQFIQDIAISPDGQKIAYLSSETLNVINSSNQLLYSKAMTVAGMSFNNDGTALILGHQSDGKINIVRESLDRTSSKILVQNGSNPKVQPDGSIYFARLNISDGKAHPSLYVLKNGEVTKVLERIPKNIISHNSNSYDVIGDEMFYTEQESERVLRAQNLYSKEIRTVYNLVGKSFSLNRTATKLITVKKAKIQNSLGKIKIVK